MTNELIAILMRRDDLTRNEAKAIVAEVKENMQIMVDEGFGLIDLEDYFQDELGLEPDYMEELLFSLR